MFGYQTWGHKTLQALIDSDHEVALAVTHPPSDHSYKGIFNDSVEQLASEHHVPVLLTELIDADVIERVKSAEPDLIVVNSWYSWMPRELYDLPRHGTINFHDSLLPKFTGFSPVLWALLAGESEVGITVHKMDEELDAGPIIMQRAIPIGPNDTGPSLVGATIELIPGLLHDVLVAIENGTATCTPQNLADRTFFHKRAVRDSIIDWRLPASELARFVRALAEPYPPAFTFYRGQRIEILQASVSDGIYGGTPGRVFIREGDGFVIVAGPDAYRGRNHGLVVTRIRTADGREHSALEFFGRGGGYLTDTP